MENNVLTYTGEGLRGDQEPSGRNQRLVEQLDKQFPIWCFQQAASRRDKAVGKNRWKFLGLLSLMRFHRETQLDADGKLRTVWLFEFDIASEPATVTTDDDTALAKDVFAHSLGNRITDPSDRQLADEDNDPNLDVALERLRGWLLAQHPRDFEFIVKKAFDTSGYKDVAVTRYSQDGGIDVVASFGTWGWPVQTRQVQVQAKRWLHTVGRKEVAELRGKHQPIRTRLPHHNQPLLESRCDRSRRSREDADYSD